MIFNKKALFLFIFCLTFFSSLYGSEKRVIDSRKRKRYLQEKISFKVKKEFDVLYPLNAKIFYFYKGEKKLSLKQFVELSNDPILIKNQKKIKKIKIAGFSTAAVFGCATVAFLIPGIIFIANMTNYNPIDDAYIVSGISMMALTGASILGLLIDLIVTFSLLYRYKFNEHTIRQAVERYNETLRKKFGIFPDLSFNTGDIILGLRVKL